MTQTTIRDFTGEVVLPGDAAYDGHREVWNAMVDRRPAIIARCESATDVAAALAFGRAEGIEIGVKGGGHGVAGFCVPDGGLMIDLSPMGSVDVDPEARRARVGGGALLGRLDAATEPHGLATTAGNVSHTGVGGLTLGGGMGWLARQFGLACDNVVAYTVVTVDGDILVASEDEHADLFWALRGGGGNFGVVTEFEFRLHPITGRALVSELMFEPGQAMDPIRRWRELLPGAPRPATLTVDIWTPKSTADLPPMLAGRPLVTVGFVWVGEMDEARAYHAEFLKAIGRPSLERVEEMSYVELQSQGDMAHVHGTRRYASGHDLIEISDAAIEAFLSRGAEDGADPQMLPNSGFQGYGGAIADVPAEASAYSQRDTLAEWFAGQGWTDPGEDAARIAAARAAGAAMAPFASGVYVNAIADEGESGIRRAYRPENLVRLRELKRRYDRDNVLHLNQNIRPVDQATH
ncbi:MAG TPA: FAD-binding oxidoreductase [Candidatus Limnocylindria bacterium]|nr:FAD-binding oxidoreductase [Candidatus Limnocylindria bacterium]